MIECSYQYHDIYQYNMPCPACESGTASQRKSLEAAYRKSPSTKNSSREIKIATKKFFCSLRELFSACAEWIFSRTY